jgi:hypothetical protein
MSLEYFEPRPPRSVAVHLDFLEDVDSSLVVSKLREIPGVCEVDIQHCDNGIRRVVINARSSVPGVLKVGHWLVSTPSSSMLMADHHLEMFGDTEFRERFQPVQPRVHIETMVVQGEEHAVMPTGSVEFR